MKIFIRYVTCSLFCFIKNVYKQAHIFFNSFFTMPIVYLQDIRGNIRKICTFLEKDLSDEEVDDIAEHCSFRNMSSNPSVNYQHWDDLGIRNKNEARFFRKGIYFFFNLKSANVFSNSECI